MTLKLAVVLLAAGTVVAQSDKPYTNPTPQSRLPIGTPGDKIEISNIYDITQEQCTKLGGTWHIMEGTGKVILTNPPISQDHCDLGSSGGAPPSITPPQPEWVPDPSAGHYDCPDGWMASKIVSLEPEKWHDPFSVNFYPGYLTQIPALDKKGHALGVRPLPPTCMQEKP